MRKYWYYCPFEDTDHAIKGTGAKYKKFMVAKAGKRDGNEEFYIDKNKSNPFAGVGNDDVLFIDGHGEIGMSNLDSQNPANRTLTSDVELFNGQKEPLAEWRSPNGLATLVYNSGQGLDRGHKVIKLLSCYGGGRSRLSKGAVVKEHGNGGLSLQKGRIELIEGENSFACLLAKSLGLKGYKDVVVGGYMGELFPGGDSGSYIALDNGLGATRLFYQYPRDEGGELNKDRDLKISLMKWYNVHGRIVKKPY